MPSNASENAPSHAAAEAADPSGCGWLETPPLSVEEQLAIDEALLDEVQLGIRRERVARTWMAEETVVVVGSSSRLDEEVDLFECRQKGVRIVRRPSGGATVLLGPGCLMWSVITPFPHGVPSLEQLHAGCLEPLCQAFAEVPLDVRRQGTSDLTVGDRKISGNALRVRQRGVLYHGTLLDDFDISLASRLLRHPPREPAYRASRRHAEFLANLGLGMPRLSRVVRQAFRAERPAAPCDPARVSRLLEGRYLREDWTARL
jgi:lipoate-protein ligase A